MSQDIWAMVISHGPLYIIALATLIRSWKTPNIHHEVKNGLADRIGDKLLEKCPALKANVEASREDQ